MAYFRDWADRVEGDKNVFECIKKLSKYDRAILELYYNVFNLFVRDFYLSAAVFDQLGIKNFYVTRMVLRDLNKIYQTELEIQSEKMKDAET